MFLFLSNWLFLYFFNLLIHHFKIYKSHHSFVILNTLLNPDNVLFLRNNRFWYEWKSNSGISVELLGKGVNRTSLSVVGARSKPQVLVNLYTTKNTKKLTITKTQAVTTFANVFNPDSFGSNGLRKCSTDRRRLVVMLLASAGNANDCVNVNLWMEPLSEYGPTEPRAAALSRAYSKSRASNSDSLPVIVLDLLLWLSSSSAGPFSSLLCRSIPFECRCSHGSDERLKFVPNPTAAIDVNDDVVLDDAVHKLPFPVAPLNSFASSIEVYNGMK